MKYQIIGKNISVTESISSYIEKKMSKIERQIVGHENIECRGVISGHKDSKKVEITVFHPQITLRAEVQNRDLYAAIDLAVDKLEGQMRKLKTRMDRSNGKMSFGRALELENIEPEPAKDEPEVVVRTKSYNLTPMTIDEAVARMEAIGHDFFLYLDKEDDRVSVVYVRRDGGYGVIQAENPIK